MAKTPLALINWVPLSNAKSLFTHQLHRFPAELVEHADSLALLSFIINIAHTDKRQEEIGQRSQIAGCAQRTAVVHNRHHVVIEKVEDTLHGNNLHTAMPQREGMRLEQHHQLDDDGTYLLAHAASMALDEVLLQGAQLRPDEMLLLHNEPKPVVMPYKGSSDSAIFLSR